MNINASVLASRKACANPRTLRSVSSKEFVARQGQILQPLPTPNPSVKRTVKGLRPSPAAYVKR